MARAADNTIYDCGICLGLPAGHVSQCRGGHLFCAECLSAHRESRSSTADKCPVCRVALGDAASAIRCLAAEQSIAAMPTICEHCQANLTRGDLKDHEPVCTRFPVRCSAAACTALVPRCDLAMHEKSCAHVMCEALETKCRALETKMTKKLDDMQRAMTAQMTAQLTEQHVLNSYRECQRFPPGPGFRVELIRRDAPEGIFEPSSQPPQSPRTPMYDRLLCLIPGVAGTDWEGGCFPLLVLYSRDLSRPPVVKFPHREGPDKPLQWFTWQTGETMFRQMPQAPTQAQMDAAKRQDATVHFMQAGFFHNNVYPSGKVCLSIFDADKAWHPSLTLAEMLLSIQHLLNHPNNSDPAQEAPYRLYRWQRAAHDVRVREQAARYTAENFERLVAQHCERPIYKGYRGDTVRWTEDGHHRIIIGQGG